MFFDIDSLTYQIKWKDVYEEFFKYKHLFDISKYKPKFFDSTNKIVIGKMKDEFKGIPINKFIRLELKTCCIVSENGQEFNTTKGVNISTEFKEYEHVLFNKKLIRCKIKRIQNKPYEIGTYDVWKISLSCFDDKRYILNDGIATLA